MGAPTKRQLELLQAAGVNRPVITVTEEAGRLVAVLLWGTVVTVELEQPAESQKARPAGPAVKPARRKK